MLRKAAEILRAKGALSLDDAKAIEAATAEVAAELTALRQVRLRVVYCGVATPPLILWGCNTSLDIASPVAHPLFLALTSLPPSHSPTKGQYKGPSGTTATRADIAVMVLKV